MDHAVPAKVMNDERRRLGEDPLDDDVGANSFDSAFSRLNVDALTREESARCGRERDERSEPVELGINLRGCPDAVVAERSPAMLGL